MTITVVETAPPECTFARHLSWSADIGQLVTELLGDHDAWASVHFGVGETEYVLVQGADWLGAPRPLLVSVDDDRGGVWIVEEDDEHDAVMESLFRWARPSGLAS